MIVDAFFFFIHIVKCVRLTLWFTRKVNQEVTKNAVDIGLAICRGDVLLVCNKSH